MPATYDYAGIRSRVRGLVLNMPIPFAPGTLEVDQAGLRRNIEHWIASGVKVLMLTYGTSEFHSLSEQEVADVTRITVETANRRALVIASTGRWWLGRAVEFAQFCETLGADVLMPTLPDIPGHPGISDVDAHVDFHRQLATRTKIALMYLSFHDLPRTVEINERVCAIDHVIGVKVDSDGYPLQHRIGQQLHDKTALVAGGGGLLAYWAHQFGYVGSLTGVGQWAPRLELDGVAKLMSGDQRAARSHLDRITPFRQLAASVGNHPSIKHAMNVAGLAGGVMRSPQRDLPEDAKRKLTELIQAQGLLGMERNARSPAS